MYKEILDNIFEMPFVFRLLEPVWSSLANKNKCVSGNRLKF